MRSDSDTDAILAARPVAKCARSLGANSADWWCQRPASTHDTGMTMAVCAPASTVTLRMRFCLAPISSSPSSSSTGWSASLTSLSSGTLPIAETSVTRASPRATASSSSR